MSKFYQHFSCSNSDEPLSENKIKEMSKSLNILSLEEEKAYIDSLTDDNDCHHESENDWIPGSFIEKLPEA